MYDKLTSELGVLFFQYKIVIVRTVIACIAGNDETLQVILSESPPVEARRRIGGTIRRSGDGPVAPVESNGLNGLIACIAVERPQANSAGLPSAVLAEVHSDVTRNATNVPSST